MASHEQIIKLHTKLAEKVKNYEQVTSKFPPIEVLNEIRYALGAAIQLLASNEISNKEHLLENLYHALIFAYHELLDGLHIEVTYFINEIDKTEIKHVLLALGEKRFEIAELLEKVGELIAKSRVNPDKRYENYDSVLYEEYFEKLLKIKKDVAAHYLPTLDSLEIEEKRRKKIDALKNISIGISAGIIVLLIGNFL